MALLGGQVVPFEIAGVQSGSTTQGHRLLGKDEVDVTIDSFADQLHANGVILSATQRRAMIEAGLGANVHRDDALLTTLVYLTEYPSTIRGSFDSKYLELPREILSTVMRYHQRYFSVDAGNGELAPEFVAVMNTNSDPEGLVRTRQRTSSASALQRRALLLGRGPAEEAFGPPGRPEERDVPG